MRLWELFSDLDHKSVEKAVPVKAPVIALESKLIRPTRKPRRPA